jgi:hypothetical protein
MLQRRRLGLMVGLGLALALLLSGCSRDCGPCRDLRGGDGGPNAFSAVFNLCLSEIPNADEPLRECTMVELEFVVVDAAP